MEGHTLLQTVLNLSVPLPSVSESLKANFYIGQEKSLLRPASSQLSVTSLGCGLSVSGLSSLVSLTSGVNMRWRDNRFSHKLTGPGLAEWSSLSQHAGHTLRSVQFNACGRAFTDTFDFILFLFPFFSFWYMNGFELSKLM